MEDHKYVSKIPKLGVNKSHKACCVPQCLNRSLTKFGSVTFHLFPKTPALKKKWEIILKMAKKSTGTSVICSEHFITSDFKISTKVTSPIKRRKLKSTALPSQNLHKRPLDQTIKSPIVRKQIERAQRASCRSLNFIKQNNILQPIENVINEDLSIDLGCKSLELEVPINSDKNVDSGFETLCFKPSKKIVCSTPNTHVPDLTNSPDFSSILSHSIPLHDKEVQVDILTDFAEMSKITVMELIKSDSNLNALTGISKIKDLDKITKISELVIGKLQYNINFKLGLKERITMTFMKLKLDLSFISLSVLFGISNSCCTNYFLETVDLLFLVFKNLIVWFPKSTIQRNMPKCFEKFMNTRVILDCTESKVERPKCLSCKIRTYSHYKGNNTIKCMIGIAPDGLITFISNIYGGRASDKHILNESGILNLCTEGDGIMVDKGFLIEKECLERSLILHRPPFLGKNKQLTLENGMHNTEIARARVHVERTIQRIKIFKFFQNKIPWTLMTKINKIMIITCGMVNMSRPIIAEDGFNVSEIVNV